MKALLRFPNPQKRRPNAILGALVLICALFGMIGGFRIAFAAAPSTGIGFQGQLYGAGSPVTASVGATFAFFDAVSGGSQQGSTITKTISVSNGYFATEFTEGELASVDFNQGLWLEVTIAGNVLTPRSAVHSVPFANKAFGAFSFGSAPAAGSAGSLYYDSGTGYLMVSNGSSWTNVGSSATQTFVIGNGFLSTATSTDGVKAAYFVATSTSATSTFAGAVGITGSLGVGTQNPVEKMQVEGNVGTGGAVAIRAVNNHTAGYSSIYAGRDGTHSVYLDYFGPTYSDAIAGGQFDADYASLAAGSGASGLNIGAIKGTGTLKFFTGGAVSANERMRITSAGNIGIGTTTPFAALTIVGAASSTGTSSPAVHIVGGNASSTGEGGGFAFYGGQGGPNTGKGGSFFVLGGTGGTNGIGGSVDLKGGVGGSANFLGGSATLMGGDGSSAGSTGGGAFVFGGNAKGTNANAGGVVLVQGGMGAGSSGAGGIGGSVSLAGGTGGTGVSAGTGGNVYIYGGSPSSGTSLYGNVILGLASSSVAQGNIGIGSSTPSAYVSIKNRSASIDAFDVASTSNASFLRVTSSGNVGIGTISPSAKLHIVGSVGGNQSVGSSVTNTDSGGRGSYFAFNDSGNYAGFQVTGSAVGGLNLANQGSIFASQGLVLFTDGNVSNGGTNSISFRTGGYDTTQERMRIASNGNVGIGTTTPAAELQVKGSGTGGTMQGTWSSNSAYGYLSLNGTNGLDSNFYSAYGGPLYINRPAGQFISFRANKTM